MTDVKCVVFDIDDTLYLERDYVWSGFLCVGEWVHRNLGIADFSELAWRFFEDGVRGSIFNLALQQRKIDPTPQLIYTLVDLYRTHEPKIQLVPDARDCFERLVGRLMLASVTDGALDSQRAKARALDLVRWMDPIVFTSELGAGFSKPNRRAFEIVEETSGCSGQECVYIADNPLKDFIGPRTLGWKTVRVRRAASLHHDRGSDADIDLEVPDLSTWVP
jgi:putative hydrolase of the HAD superfamily